MHKKNAARSGRDPIASFIYENIPTLATQIIYHRPSFDATKAETYFPGMFTAVCERFVADSELVRDESLTSPP